MANSKLLNTKFIIPKDLIHYYVNKIGVDYLAPQLRGFLERGYLTYDDMKNHLKFYPDYPEKEKKQHGGSPFFKWVNLALTRKRNHIEKQKDFKDKVGLHNTHNKTHDRNLGDAHTKKGVYENVKTIYITENQINIIKNANIKLF